MASDPRARERFRVAYDIAQRWMESSETAAKTGNPSLVIEASHLVVHNAVAAYRGLRLGRGGRLRHKEVGSKAAELGMPPELVDCVKTAEGLHVPVSYGSPSPTEEQGRKALEIARRVLAYVRAEAKKAGALPAPK